MELIKLMDQFEYFFVTYGYLVVFLASLIEITPAGFTIPGGTLLALAGFFAFGTKLSLVAFLLAGWLGAWTTFLLAYILGYKTGPYFIKKFRQEKNAKKARILLKNHGATILTTSMLASLTRFWVAYIAGEEKYSFAKFIFYSGSASLTWSSFMIIVGYLAGSGRTTMEKGLSQLGILSWLLITLVGLLFYLKIKKEIDRGWQ